MRQLRDQLKWVKGRGRTSRVAASAAKVKGLFPPPPTSLQPWVYDAIFTPCTLSHSLLEAVADTRRNPVLGDVFLLSPACSIFDESRDYQQIGGIH
jgi:UDP-N-acetylmuramoylalanine-D-glutamate ligase